MLIRDTEFDTAGLHPQEGRAAYLKAIGNALETQFLSEEFAAAFIAYTIADQRIISLTASPRRSERTIKLIEDDLRDQISFQYVLAGSATGRANGRPINSTPGTLLIFDLSQRFFLEDHEFRSVINLSVPRASIAQLIDDPRKLHGAIISGGPGMLLSNLMQSVIACIGQLSAAAGPAIASTFIELISVLINSVVGRGEGAKVNPAAAASERALRLIDSRIGSRELTPEWLAREINVSRSQLYAMFAGHGGISKLIWRRRLEFARLALCSPSDGRRIGEIAFALGFSTESHFTRTFKDAFGVTPKAFRQAASRRTLDAQDNANVRTHAASKSSLSSAEDRVVRS